VYKNDWYRLNIIKRTLEKVISANGSRINVQYKLSNVKICKNKIYYHTSFVLIKKELNLFKESSISYIKRKNK